MSRRAKPVPILGVVLLGVSAAVVPATPAFAAFQCNPTSINGGVEVCIDYDPQGYRAGYRSTLQVRGNWLDFNLRCDSGVWFGSNGSFLANQGSRWYTYVFRVGSQGRCHVTLYDRSAGGQADSPSVTR
jgi:hypothetical protein